MTDVDIGPADRLRRVALGDARGSQDVGRLRVTLCGPGRGRAQRGGGRFPRAAGLALAALPNFVLPGRVSASDRYYASDVTTPFNITDGRLDVPRGAGIGVEPHTDILQEPTSSVEVIKT
jgi:hypothetical protein